MNKSKQAVLRRNFRKTGTTTAAGANGGWSRQYFDVYLLLEAIAGTDGQKPKIHRMLFNVQCHQTTNETNPFIVQPVVVQTNGTWTASANLAIEGPETVLTSSIDDVFGSEVLADIFSHRSPISAATGGGQAVNRTLVIPQHVVDIINKEVETERLQNIFLGVVGTAAGSTDIEEFGFLVVEYTRTNKKVLLR
jgi:hypothetical protein